MASRLCIRALQSVIEQSLQMSSCRSYLYKHCLRPSVLQVRGYKEHVPVLLRELYRRKIEEGEKPPTPRRDYLDWNFDAELYAFGARLGERFDPDLLRRAFVSPSYAEKEKVKQQELGLNIEDETLHNADLAEKGKNLTSTYIKSLLRNYLPYVPEDGILAIHSYLLSTEVLGDIALHLGMKELLFGGEYPPCTSEMSSALLAVIGCTSDDDEERSHLFIKDFIFSYLVGKDVNELWHIKNPLGVLKEIVVRSGQEEPEARLTREAGKNTITATYSVGIYSEKKLLGDGAGESIDIAVEEAARDALKRLFRTKESDIQFAGPTKVAKNTPNLDLSSWTEQKVAHNLVTL